MTDWPDCIVPEEVVRPWVWVAYGKDSPYLPIAVADTAGELARMLGVPEINVRSVVSKHNKGKIKRPRYAKVYTGEE